MKSRLLLVFATGAVIASPAAAQERPRLGDTLPFTEIRDAAQASELLRAIRRLPVQEQQAAFIAVSVDPRIVGGYSVTIADNPWQVALVRAYLPGRSQFCGGSLIAANVVVTAAHCVDNSIVRNDPARVDIVAGTTGYASGGDRLRVAAIYRHPQWDSSTQDYDIAILRLQSSSAAGRAVPIEPQPAAVGSLAFVTGWGALSEGGPGAEQLMGVALPIVDSAVCNHPDSYGGAVTDRMLCAGEQEGGRDSCQGDSGGPLTLTQGGTTRLIGLVSFGEGCARRLKYGVYTRVSSVAAWIQSFLGN